MRYILLLFAVLCFCSCKMEKNSFSNYVDDKDLSKPNLLVELDVENKIIDFSPALSPDMKGVYYVVSDSLFSVYEINYYCFATGENNKLSFSDGLKDYSPFVSNDGENLYFASYRLNNKSEELKEDPDIWVSKREGEKWLTPEIIGDSVNTIYGEGFVSVAANGNLYFESNRLGGYGDWDIYLAEKSENGYSKPKNLGMGINTELNESDPYIAPDESFLIFGSYNRDDGFGSSDLYISFKNSDGEFGDAINLGDVVNTEFLEHNPHVSADGKYFFFNTDKPLNQDMEYKVANFNTFYMSTNFIEELKDNYTSVKR